MQDGKAEMTDRQKMWLAGHSYSSCGAYFVTVCAAGKNAPLWAPGAVCIRADDPPLSEYGKIVRATVEQLPSHYKNVIVDKYCIMPDHMHMIVFITPDENERMMPAPALSAVVSSLKRWTSRQIGSSIWQRSFYQRVIRNEQAYRGTCRYIEENPLNWNPNDT